MQLLRLDFVVSVDINLSESCIHILSGQRHNDMVSFEETLKEETELLSVEVFVAVAIKPQTCQ